MLTVHTEYGPVKGLKVEVKRRFKVEKEKPRRISRRITSYASAILEGGQTQLLNPLTGSENFGFLRCSQFNEYLPIHLFRGYHDATSNGYGLKHIWEGHSDHVMANGFLKISEVGHFLGQFFNSQPDVFCLNDYAKSRRVKVVHKDYGTVILELRRKYGRTCWSIITAHQGTTKGAKPIGSVKPTRQE